MRHQYLRPGPVFKAEEHLGWPRVSTAKGQLGQSVAEDTSEVNVICVVRSSGELGMSSEWTTRDGGAAISARHQRAGHRVSESV